MIQLKLKTTKAVSARALLIVGALLGGLPGLPVYAAFPYTGGNLTASATFDGLGANSAQNPLTIGPAANASGPANDDYIGTSAGSGVLTVLSGTLTMNCDDFKVPNQAGANTGTVNVGAGATYNINMVGKWSAAIGQQSSGSMTISNGATVNYFASGTNEQRFAVGNSGTCSSILTLLGGTLNVNLDPARTLSDAQRCFCVGVGSTCPGTINLMSGTLNDNMPLPFALGGQYGGMTTTPVFNQASVSVMIISNGVFVMTNICAATDAGKATFSVASGSYVNFLSGGTGQLSLVNYQLSDYSSLVSAGQIRINGASAVMSQFTYSLVGNQGRLSLSPPGTPYFATQPASVSAYMGRTVQFSAVVDGAPTLTYQWQRGPVGGPYTNLVAGVNISGSTSLTLTVSHVAATTLNEYVLIASNSIAAVQSSPADFTLLTPVLSGAYSSNALTLSPVAYWPLNDDTLDPYRNAGAPLYDAAGTHDGTYLAQSWNGNDGILGPQPADGCPLFNAGQGAMETISNLDQSWAIVPALNLNTNTVTITMWVKPFGLQSAAAGLFFDGNPGNNSGVCYAGLNQQLGYVWNGEPGTVSYTNGPVIPTNVWSFIAVVISPGIASFYVINTGGVTSSTHTYNHVVVPWSGSANPDPLCRIGCSQTVSNTFNGLIDEVAVFNYDLTPGQIQNMAGFTPGNVSSVSPVVTNLVTAIVSNNTVCVSWPPTYVGWILQVQTNNSSVGMSTNWINVSGATTTSLMTFPINTGNGCVFYRLVSSNPGSSIDRQALVARHNIQWNDPAGQIPLGNGEFCFNADGTGLQTFGGNSMSHWAWHSFPLPAGVTADQIPPTGTFEQGHITGPDAAADSSVITQWMYDNPHIMNLGRMRFCKADGTALASGDISGLSRTLDLWSGTQTANYLVDGVAVSVETCVNPTLDAVAVRINSSLVGNGGLQVVLDFPYPSLTQYQPYVGDFSMAGNESNQTTMAVNGLTANFARAVDSMSYDVSLALSGGGNVVANAQTPNTYSISAPGTNNLEFTCAYSSAPITGALPAVETSFEAASNHWQNFWSTGGAIDLSASSNTNWFELERRIVLSQYEEAVQNAGSWEEAEVGLMGIDPWCGQFHMEMLWWHLAHYALWDRWPMAERQLDCYQTFMPQARALAAQLDYAGLKWPKSVGPEGRSAPWTGNQVLLWKEPHPIFFAELDYRLHPTQATLEKWYPIIYGTAQHMADYATLDTNTGIYSLAFDLPPSEKAIWTNTVFDLAYWRWGLNQAQVWRQRLGLARESHWDQVLANLAPLPVADGVFVNYPGSTDTYTTYTYSHPDPIGVYGMLPPIEGVDPMVAHSTVLKVWSTWNWNNVWGWDFPWLAMAAARTGEPQIAINALLDNYYTFDQRGVNSAGNNPYLPGNGGLLYAVAMMAAGWDGCPAGPAPGFPNDGSWTVKWEGLKKAP